MCIVIIVYAKPKRMKRSFLSVRKLISNRHSDKKTKVTENKHFNISKNNDAELRRKC